jgi:hypothetical protein
MFSVSTETERERGVGILATEIKGTRRAWSETKKDLRKTKRENKNYGRLRYIR